MNKIAWPYVYLLLWVTKITLCYVRIGWGDKMLAIRALSNHNGASKILTGIMTNIDISYVQRISHIMSKINRSTFHWSGQYWIGLSKFYIDRQNIIC